MINKIKENKIYNKVITYVELRKTINMNKVYNIESRENRAEAKFDTGYDYTLMRLDS